MIPAAAEPDREGYLLVFWKLAPLAQGKSLTQFRVIDATCCKLTSKRTRPNVAVTWQFISAAKLDLALWRWSREMRIDCTAERRFSHPGWRQCIVIKMDIYYCTDLVVAHGKWHRSRHRTPSPRPLLPRPPLAYTP